MASKTNICNQSLLLLGESVITDIDEGTTVADTCKVFYESAKQAVLREHEWNCAMARAVFTLSATTPDYEWEYEHVLPTDCLRVIEIDQLRGEQWHVEGRVLLSDSATVQGRYVRDIAEGLMDPMVVKALAAYLASELAYPICESNTKADQMLRLYGLRTINAGSANKLEGSTKRAGAGSLVSCR